MALLVLLFTIAIIFILPQIIPSKKWQPTEKDIAAFQNLKSLPEKDPVNSDSAEEDLQTHYIEPSVEVTVTTQLFPFDPNTISIRQWQQLGVRKRTITTIQRYLARGGRFEKPEDLQKIYGLHPEVYSKLKPYVRIAGRVTALEIQHEKDTVLLKSNSSHSKKSRETALVELNSADTSDLIQLPGIGSKLANRIIRFRDKLGGFYSVDQVGETYGLPDSTFRTIKQFLILGKNSCNRINVNAADAATLKEHPYIGWRVARSLIEYRAQHGPFKTMEEISKVSSLTPEQFKRLIPYLSID